MGDSLLLPLFSFSGIDVNRSKRLSPTPSVSNLSLRPCCYLSTVTQSSSRASVDGFRRERLQKFATFDSLSVQRHEWKRMERRTIVCYLGGIWRRLEQLEQIYGRLPSVDQLSRFAGVPNVGRSCWNADNADCRLQTADCADRADCADCAHWLLFFFTCTLIF